MSPQPISDSNFDFPQATVEQAVRQGKLLSMEIEFSLKCNFRCPYCYVPHGAQLKNELTVAEIKSAIFQAKAAGALKIIVLGGEPSIYPHTLELIRFMREHDLVVEMFTNGSGVTGAFAKALAGMQVRVVLKMNSFDPERQKQLSGHPDAYDIKAFQDEEELKKKRNGFKWLKSYLKYKYRDSYLFRHAEDKVDKPIHYICLLTFENALNTALHKALRLELPVGRASSRWKRELVRSCQVVNLEKWNKHFPKWPVCRAEEGVA